MSSLDEAKALATKLSGDISKNHANVFAQFQQVNVITYQIASLIGNTNSRKEKEIIESLRNASKECGKALEDLSEAASTLTKWSAES